MVGIFALLIGERMLPTVVGHHAVSDVAFHLKPTAQGRNGPIAWQGQSHLGHRTRVDSQRLRPTAQPIVLQLHGLLLGSDGQCAMKPTALNKRLLHHHVAGVMKRGGHIEAISHAPTARRVVEQRANGRGAHIAIGLVERRQAMFIGVEPQGRLVFRERALCLHSVPNALTQVQLARAGIVLPSILGHHRCGGQQRHKRKDRMFHLHLFSGLGWIAEAPPHYL